ncbi:hypothetical protein B0T26DRAFT_230203 [Lasiosphaeria miniovina]|uniref:Uncharacterized protein n=1 Tax=Lasiosphaeria miniovina TaxID=1954250 RepID=A0AA40AVH6_9PEZI|nr:uncharacterized protein B0T26DRAFT_230203 [Lasiosphaeria miniovina]KAK0722726.1 hypothetical protein B0T26DRAFT_230203 [Lasiosphaeria miniovina]
MVMCIHYYGMYKPAVGGGRGERRGRNRQVAFPYSDSSVLRLCDFGAGLGPYVWEKIPRRWLVSSTCTNEYLVCPRSSQSSSSKGTQVPLKRLCTLNLYTRWQQMGYAGQGEREERDNEPCSIVPRLRDKKTKRQKSVRVPGPCRGKRRGSENAESEPQTGVLGMGGEGLCFSDEAQNRYSYDTTRAQIWSQQSVTDPKNRQPGTSRRRCCTVNPL